MNLNVLWRQLPGRVSSFLHWLFTTDQFLSDFDRHSSPSSATTKSLCDNSAFVDNIGSFAKEVYLLRFFTQSQITRQRLFPIASRKMCEATVSIELAIHQQISYSSDSYAIDDKRIHWIEEYLAKVSDDRTQSVSVGRGIWKLSFDLIGLDVEASLSEISPLTLSTCTSFLCSDRCRANIEKRCVYRHGCVTHLTLHPKIWKSRPCRSIYAEEIRLLIDCLFYPCPDEALPSGSCPDEAS